MATLHCVLLAEARKTGIIDDHRFEEICDLIQKDQRKCRDQSDNNRLKWENTASAV